MITLFYLFAGVVVYFSGMVFTAYLFDKIVSTPPKFITDYFIFWLVIWPIFIPMVLSELAYQELNMSIEYAPLVSIPIMSFTIIIYYFVINFLSKI